MNRRKFLAILGGGTILAATASVAAFVTTRTPTKALAPWQLAGSSYSDPRKRALSFALLAPNPHNRQPWLVDLSAADKISLFVDTDKMLPHTDPYNRQITIGLGCFLELLRMATAEDGYRAVIERFPEGYDDAALDAKPVAVVSLRKDKEVQKDPLFAHVLNRRSLKEPFDTSKPVSSEILQALENVVLPDNRVGTSKDSKFVDSMRDLTARAMDIEVKTPRTYQESVDLFRIGKAEVEKNPDGIDFSGPMFDTLGATGLFTRESALDTTTATYQQGMDAVMTPLATAMGYVWLVSRTNTRLDQLNAGRDWIRINLAATGKNVGLHPISQALQEYPEMKTQFDRCRKILAADGGTVQMLGRLGYAEAVPPSPRWPLESKIIKA
jgi:hypothetical protein